MAEKTLGEVPSIIAYLPRPAKKLLGQMVLKSARHLPWFFIREVCRIRPRAAMSRPFLWQYPGKSLPRAGKWDTLCALSERCYR